MAKDGSDLGACSNSSDDGSGGGAIMSRENAVGALIEVAAASICIIGMNAMRAARVGEREVRRRRSVAGLGGAPPAAAGAAACDSEGSVSDDESVTTAVSSETLAEVCSGECRRSCRQLCHPQWLAALFVYGAGEGMQVFALGWGDASVVQSVSMFALVLNAYIARFYFGEELPPRAVAATALVIIGAVLASFGGITPPCLDLHVFENHFDHWTSVVAFSVLGGVLVTTTGLLVAGVHSSIGCIRENVVRRYSLLNAVLASTLGTFSFFCAGVFSKLGKAAIDDGSGSSSVVVSGGILLCVACSELYVLNSGLSRCESSVFIPTYYVLITLFLLIANTAFFSEEAADQYDANVYKAPMFGVGVVLIVAGVWSLAALEASRKQAEGAAAAAGATAGASSPRSRRSRRSQRSQYSAVSASRRWCGYQPVHTSDLSDPVHVSDPPVDAESPADPPAEPASGAGHSHPPPSPGRPGEG